MNGTKWTVIEREDFLNSVIAICELSCTMLNTIKHATNYMIGKNDFTEVLSCNAYGYEYEIDKTLGCYRFRSIKEGPWTRWRSMEAA